MSVILYRNLRLFLLIRHFLHDSPSILILIPMFGNFSASFMTLSSNHPDVEITTRGDFRNITSTISSRSSRTNGSPPVRFTNFTLGSFSSSFLLVFLCFFCWILPYTAHFYIASDTCSSDDAHICRG